MHRREPGEVDVLYGINAVAEALGRRPVEHVLVGEGQRNARVQQIIDACRATSVPVRFAPRAALERAAGTTQHQNVVAVCSARGYDDLETLLRPQGPGAQPSLVVVLDGVEDPANLGAVVRTTVAAGGSGVVIPERRAAGLSAAVAHAAAGALEHAKVVRVTNLVRTLGDLKERGVWIYGFDPAGSKSYLALDYTLACAVVFGGEGRGIHRLVRESCDQLARIPLQEPVNSLNVSVAAGVVLYEAVRQRTQGGKPAVEGRTSPRAC
jgi:23S rRNA (guanosine2251-2'-O)-methyltransferase